ncbi:MAG: hypothetical protein AB7I19_09405 [Planctomycetota bacterium]
MFLACAAPTIPTDRSGGRAFDSSSGQTPHSSATAMQTLNSLRCLAGLDEAGLGPILGPMVVAGVALEGPAGCDPWSALAAAVTRNRPRERQIQVADSKKVHQGAAGFARLERTVLGFWAAWTGGIPTTIEGLLAKTATDLNRLRRCPWYSELDVALPLANRREDLELTGHLLAAAMNDARIVAVHATALAVDVEEFNATIAATDNKSDTHLRHYVRVLADLLAQTPPQAHVIADRAGGRAHYQRSLAKAFPGASVQRIQESESVSSYAIQQADGERRVTFATGGEERAFPTALASCFAKYVRELLMHTLNDWFALRIPGLRRTAGYWVDGQRFLADIDSYLSSHSLPRERLVRVR